ncbi:ATP-binding protein [Salinifilum aidingensis]
MVMSSSRERTIEPGTSRLGHEAELTSFVGRRGAVSGIKRLLSNSRLVTLTGTPGVGKTRLARRAAHDVRRAFPGGVRFVELADLPEPADVAVAVLAGLDQDAEPHHPVPGGRASTPARPAAGEPADAETWLARHLSGPRVLLVLDGCEQLVEDCGDLVRELLAAVPSLRVLVTSRSPLGIAGEQVWTVSPLSLPGFERSGEIAASEAVRLFTARASAVAPGFTLNADNERRVARVCRQLDGLPLAIELAAGWMRSLSMDDLIERLADPYALLSAGARDAPPRHRSLRAAVEASYALCTPVEQAVWARLSVFTGGFELEAAEEVCAGDGLNRSDVFSAVAGLVDKSVLQPEPQDDRARYRLLRTIGEYGRHRLGSGPVRERLRRRHRDYYLHLAEDVDVAWLGPNQVEWLGRLRADRGNFDAALDYSVTEPGESDEALRLAAALWFAWIASGELRAGWEWLTRAWEAADEPSSPGDAVAARAAVVTALIAALSGDVAACRQACAGARAVGASDDDLAQATGLASLLEGDADEAWRWLSLAVSRSRERAVSGALGMPNLALAAVVRGEPERARELCERCQELCAEHGELWCWSWADVVLGLVEWSVGDVAAALTRLREALRVKYLFRDVLGIVTCLEAVAWVEVGRGRAVRAERLFAAVTELAPVAGGYPFALGAFRAWRAEAVQRVRAALAERDRASAAERGARCTVDEAVRFALGGRRADSGAEVPAQLTPREREVARLVARGLSNREIAERLVIAKRTSDSHVEHILAKLGFTSRAQIAAWVAEQRVEA